MKEIRGKKRYAYAEDPYEPFWNELEDILRTNPCSKKDEWERLDNDGVVLGEVWSQNIGEFYYNHTVHRFSYLYVESEGLAIGEHRNEEPANNGKPIYVLSVKICSKGTR